MIIRPTQQLPNVNYDAIRNKIQCTYSANQSLWQTYWTESAINTRLEAGDSSLINGGLTNALANNRNEFYYNYTRPLLNMVSGHQRRNRKSSIIIPLENADQKTADQWTKILLHVFKRERLYHTISDAFHQGACIAGMNLLHIYLDFRSDPINGDIKIDNLAYNQFFIDPYFRKKDLSDAAFVWRRTFMNHATAASLMPPENYDAIMNLPGNPTGTARDGRFQYMPEASGQAFQNLLAYDEYYYRDYRKQKLLIDKMTGEQFDVSSQEHMDIETFLEHNPDTTLIEQDIPTVRLAIMIQDQVFYDGINPLGIDNYPFIPIMGYYNPSMPYFYSRIQAIASSLRDPQVLLNRRIQLSHDMSESMATTGFIFKGDSLVDIKHLYQTGAGRMIPVKPSCNIAQDIVPIPPPQVPASYFQIAETDEQALYKTSGISEVLMGSSLDAKAGIIEVLRQSAGLTTLQPIFDNLDDSQIMVTERLMEVISANFAPYKIRQILEGAEPAPLFFNKAFGKYHAMVEAGFNTDSQKQMEFAQALQLVELGVPIPHKSLIRMATLQNKDQLIQEMEQEQQQLMQREDQQNQVAMQEGQARIKLALSRAGADEGLEWERKSRMEENRALAIKQLAEANKEDELAVLNKVKILKEIEDMDIGHLERLVGIAKLLKNNESTEKTQGAVL